MADSSETPDVIDLAADPNRMVKVAGRENPIPAAQLMSKDEFTRSTQAYAARERELRETYAEAQQLVEQLREDPVEFHRALSERLQLDGMTPYQARAQANEMIDGIQNGGAPQMTMDDSGQWQMVQQELAALRQNNEALQRVVFEEQANKAISSEIASARAHEAEIAKRLGREGKDLTDGEIREVLAVAQKHGLKDLSVAHKVWKHDQLLTDAENLRGEVEITKRKAEMPWLGGGSEAGIATPAKKISLRDAYERNIGSRLT